MSAWDWVAVGALAWLTLCALATIGVSRWGRRMAAKNQLLQLDRELNERTNNVTT